MFVLCYSLSDTAELVFRGVSGVARCFAPCAVFRGAEPKYIWFYIIRFVSVISAYNQFNALKMPYNIYMEFSTWRLITLFYYILLSLLFVFCFIAFNRAFNRFTPFLTVSLCFLLFAFSFYRLFYFIAFILFIFIVFFSFCVIMALFARALFIEPLAPRAFRRGGGGFRRFPPVCNLCG